MDRNELERLVSLEIDGRLPAEDERKLNEFTSRDASADRARHAMHDIHRAFQEMERPAPADDLSSRIADRVLDAPAPVHRFGSVGGLSRAAASVLLLALVAVGGWWVSTGSEVSAKDKELQEWRDRTLVQWSTACDGELSRAQLRQIVEIKESFRGADPEKGDLETGSVLRLLDDFGVLELYCERHEISMGKAAALIKQAAKGR